MPKAVKTRKTPQKRARDGAFADQRMEKRARDGAVTDRKVKWIQHALEDAKAHDVAVLDVRRISDFTDYMVIATGTSNRHVQSTADKVVDALRGHGVRPVGVEGERIGDWILIDFGDVVAHVMREQTRDFYNIEKLWSDARHVGPETRSPRPRKKKAKPQMNAD